MVGLSLDLQFVSETGAIQFVPVLADLLVQSSSLDSKELDL
jgi:hypothetical protein